MRMIEQFNAGGEAPVLVLCDHAGRLIPDGIDLGIDDATLARHIGWDIGAADTSRHLAELLGAPAILDHCSRLVIDSNRRPGTASAIPPISDGCVVPGNVELPAERARARMREFWLPYHRAVAARLAAFRRRRVVPAIVAIHSFTPSMAGLDRPWQVGVLWRGDRRLAGPVLATLSRGDLVVGDNEPYSGLAEFGYTIEFHGQRTGLPHVMLEVRQDEIDTAAGARRWAGIIAASLRTPLADPRLYHAYQRSPDTVTWRHYRMTGSD